MAEELWTPRSGIVAMTSGSPREDRYTFFRVTDKPRLGGHIDKIKSAYDSFAQLGTISDDDMMVIEGAYRCKPTQGLMGLATPCLEWVFGPLDDEYQHYTILTKEPEGRDPANRPLGPVERELGKVPKGWQDPSVGYAFVPNVKDLKLEARVRAQTEGEQRRIAQDLRGRLPRATIEGGEQTVSLWGIIPVWDNITRLEQLQANNYRECYTIDVTLKADPKEIIRSYKQIQQVVENLEDTLPAIAEPTLRTLSRVDYQLNPL